MLDGVINSAGSGMRYAAVALMIGACLLVGCSDPGLTSCRVCGDKVAKEAEACPHCGAPKPYEGETKTTWHKNGQKRWEEHYKNGEQEGLETWWYENGQKERETHYKEGKEDGLETWWYRSGKKGTEIHWKNGKEDGFQTFWHENGQKMEECYYKDGKKDGLETEWDENGKKKLEAQYKDDKEVSRRNF
jgi:hypothetical protein